MSIDDADDKIDQGGDILLRFSDVRRASETQDRAERQGIELHLMFLDAFIRAPEPWEAPDQTLSLALMNLQALAMRIRPESNSIAFLREREGQHGLCKRAAAALIAFKKELTPEIQNLLSLLDITVDAESIKAAREAMRPESQSENERDQIEQFLPKLQRYLDTRDIVIESSFDVEKLADALLKAKDCETLPDSAIDKTMGRDWLVPAITVVLERNPDATDELLQLLNDIWVNWDLTDFKSIADGVKDHLGIPNEQRARRNARNSTQWFNIVVNQRQPIDTVLGRMLARYRLDFEGENQAYGEQFAWVYLDELTKCVARYNASKQRIDDLFILRVRAYFAKNGVNLR